MPGKAGEEGQHLNAQPPTPNLAAIKQHYADRVDHSVLDPWEELIDAAAKAEDRRAYRENVEGYLNAVLEAIEAVQKAVAGEIRNNY